MWATVALILVGLGTWIWLWSRKAYSVFRKHGVPEAPGWFPLGSQPTWKLLTGTAFTQMYEDTYNKYKDQKMVGTYGIGGSLNLLIMDVEMIKTVLVKDFEYLADRREMHLQNKYLDNMLTILTGEKWKQMRNMITPIFTSGKLKATLPLLDEIGDNFVQHLEKYATEGIDFEAKEMMTKFSLEVIASAGFGVNAKAFDDHNGVFADNVARLMRSGKYKQSMWDGIKMMLIFFVWPKLNKILSWKIIDEKAMEFLTNIMRVQMEDRRKNPGKRGDFIDILTQISEAEKGKDSSFQSVEDFETAVIANAFVMFFAGFDTSSSASSLCCYFFTMNPEIQERVYQIIKEAIDENDGNQNLDYNSIQKLTYLDQCIHESFRAYPMIMLERRVSKPYKVPGTEMVLPKDALVTVSSVELNGDPAYFETPDKFNPDHFSEEQVSKRGPYPDSTFGHGPRNCVGKRFALLQLKVALVRLLANYKLVPCEKTVNKLEVDPMSSNFMPKGGMWMKVEKRV